MKELFDILQHHASGTPSFLMAITPHSVASLHQVGLTTITPFYGSDTILIFQPKIYTFFQLFSVQISHFSKSISGDQCKKVLIKIRLLWR